MIQEQAKLMMVIEARTTVAVGWSLIRELLEMLVYFDWGDPYTDIYIYQNVHLRLVHFYIPGKIYSNKKINTSKVTKKIF